MRSTGFRRKPYLIANAFELVIAALAILSTVAYVVYPESASASAVGRALHPYDAVWIFGYGIAGLGITVGLVRPSPRLELAGLVLMGAAMTINAVAVVSLRGSHAVLPLLSYLAVGIACYVRGYGIVRAGQAK